MCILGYLFFLLKEKNLLQEQTFFSFITPITTHPILFALCILLLPVNWGIEALKWFRVINKAEKVKFLHAFTGTLTGVTLGLVTPHGIGDYPGRILQLSSYNRFRFVGPLFLARISQFLVTLIAGGTALLLFLNEVMTGQFFLFEVLTWLSILSFCLAGLIYLFQPYLVNKVRQFPFIWKYFGMLSQFSTMETLEIFFLSILRYIIFTVQFFLLLKVFSVSGNIAHLFIGINLVFFAKSLIPTLFDFGVREFSALYFFGEMGFPQEPVIWSSLALWFINILLPAFVGSFLIFKLKLSSF